MRRIAVLDAPSNLGLRPPTETSVPGCAKAPGALRDKGLLTKLDARDAGCLTPPRYDAGDWRPGDGVAHAPQIAAYSRALADRIGAILDAGEFPVVLGGDCSIVLGSGLAMHRLGEAVGGRIGLVFVDGHSDFRHPGNASYVGAAAGEDLALVTGRGQADLAAIEGRRPYFRDIDVVVMGIRAQDEYRLDLQAAGIVTRPVPALRAEGAARSAQWARDQLVDCAGYWVHVDVDVLDPAVMPAVDAPSPGGIAFPELEILLAGLVESPHCLGVEITVFDPDYDADGSYATEIVNAVTAGLAAAHTVTPRPDLIAARADLNRTEAAPVAASLRLAGSEETVEATEEARPGAPKDDEDDRLGLAAGLGRPGRPGGLRRASSADASSADASSADEEDRGERPSRPGGLKRAGSTSEDPVARPGALKRIGFGEDGDRWGLGGGLNRSERPAGLNRPSASFEEEREREKRRAAAAGDSVSLAAAGMSSGDPGGPDEAALPATTLLGVEDGNKLPAEQADVDGDAGDEFAADDEGAGTAGSAVEYVEESVAHSADDVAAEVGADDAGQSADDAGQSADDGPADHWTDEPADPDEGEDEDDLDDDGQPTRLLPRPLGQAPLLDSEPLPATRPGMLRPRTAEDREGFSLPAQRPAFELGSGTPADVV